MADIVSPSGIWADILAVRERSPLVQRITNLGVMNFNANVLLAVGASPVMAQSLLLSTALPTVIRGNGSEIMRRHCRSLGAGAAHARGGVRERPDRPHSGCKAPLDKPLLRRACNSK